MAKSKERLFLIDGSSFFYRAFYAIRNLSTSRGQPTNAVFGVVTMLKKLMEEEHPDYLAVALDRPEPTFRHQRFERYKIHRPPMPEPLVSQLPWIKEVFQAYRIPAFERAGFEADDLLGTIAVEAARKGLEVFLVTGDKDALQLLGPHVKVYRPTREGHEIIDEESLSKRWNLRPAQVVDVMALMGDEIDAIPGVPGIGEKTAVELIQKFGSVEKLLKKLDELPRPALSASLKEHTEQLKTSRELCLLETQVPVEVDLQQMRLKAPDREHLKRIFQTLEFRNLLKELTRDSPAIEGRVQILTQVHAGDLPLPLIRKQGRVAAAVIESEEELAVGLAWEEGQAQAVLCRTFPEGWLPLWNDPKIRKICPNLKEAWVRLGRHGLSLDDPDSSQGSWEDPELCSYLLDPSRPSHRIERLSAELLGGSVEDPDPVRAAGLRALAALQLFPRLEKEVREKGASLLLKEVEIPLSFVLARMELAGIAVDGKQLEDLSKEMERTLEGLVVKIVAQAGEPFNINSPKQLGRILFERLNLPVLKRTKTGPSTDEEVLRRLAVSHELPATILEYRELFKLKSTYVDALPKLIDPKTGRIHSSFNQTVTSTGRLSSSEPNLQNIPIRTELGRQIRKVFVPRPGWFFLSADYSQIELRILAHLSQDEGLLSAFREGEDIHRVTAAEIFHIGPEKVSADERAVAKTINFGIVYGMSPFGLAKELGIPQDQAQEFIGRYFERYPGIRSALARSLEQARRDGYCTTLLNRRRYIPELNAKDPVIRQFAERMAVNAPVQGSAADLIKVAMVALDRAMRGKRMASRMLLTVHDELVFEAPPDELEEMKRLVKETMESPALQGKPIRLSVPLEVRMTVGRNWLEASH